MTSQSSETEVESQTELPKSSEPPYTELTSLRVAALEYALDYWKARAESDEDVNIPSHISIVIDTARTIEKFLVREYYHEQ